MLAFYLCENAEDDVLAGRCMRNFLDMRPHYGIMAHC